MRRAWRSTALRKSEGPALKLFESMMTALTALRANKLRSVLTMLGVIIGVSSIILLVSLGSGARSEITTGIQGMGSNLIIVMPFKLELGSMNVMQQGSPMTALNKFTPNTVDEIGRALGNPGAVSPEYQRSVYMSNGPKRYFGIIIGAGHNEFEVRSVSTSSGRFFTKSEQDTARPVIVIGQTVARSLFGDENPIGRFINVKGFKFKVLGIQEPKGSTLTFDMDAQCWIPATTSIRLFGTTHPNFIVAKAGSPATVKDDAQKIKDTLAKNFSTDEFSVITQSDVLGFAQNITRILTYLLGGVAGISLLVGGIGIMNIMLVSVTERTREVGIRKAVGAKTRDIMLQFLVEAVTLSLLGGIIGTLLAMGGALLYEHLLHLKADVTVWIVLLAFMFSMMVGVFFGVYPARKASLLDPIESLRYE
jgi:putative ABC transport system permease protein